MMKIPFLLILFALFSFALRGQQSMATIEYCGQQLEIPEGCSAASAHELDCDRYALQWLYIESDMLSFTPQQYVSQLEDRLKKFRKKSITCFSLGNELKGYKVSYKEDKELKYRIIAYGTVNQQPVLLNLSLDKEPVNNDALPEFSKKILTLKE